MTLGVKIINGIAWPESDTQACQIVPQQVTDVEVALQYVRERGVVIQAGGNVGIWPLYLAKTFSEVWSYEPDPTNFACLSRNTHLVRNIHICQVALGEGKERLVKMIYPEGMSNMGAAAVDMAPDATIACLALDDLHFSRVDLIQLDVEGYEPFVIAGAAETIARQRPVLMLEDKGLTVKYGVKDGWSMDWAARNGYKFMDRVNRDNIFIPEG